MDAVINLIEIGEKEKLILIIYDIITMKAKRVI